jgi:signal transduction histidine kinase
MRTLFVKTLLWFLCTTFITFTTIVGTMALTFNSRDQREAPFGMLVSLGLAQARHAYETGGRPSLETALKRFQNVTHAESVLTDENGIDLATGQDRSDLLRDARTPRLFPEFRRERTIVARRSPNGGYWFFLMLHRTNWIGWFIRPWRNPVVVGLLLLMCYLFARHLTNPVRELKKAVDRFGQGDLTARVQSTRRDELGELACAFDQMADRTQTLLAAERRLLLDISHELRSPLARLNVAVELARSGGDSESQLNRIQKEADRLSALVGELLQVTRAEGDPSQRKLEPVQLDSLVIDVVEDSRIEADARGVKVELIAPAGIKLSGDEELLRRAIENVVRNAIRYAPVGTAVEVVVKDMPGHAAIRVRDYGSGVPIDALPRLFDPFYRVDTDRNRASGGVGLGLAIARRAVELHKGTVQAANANPGLLVEIDLPRVEPAQRAVISDPSSSLSVRG